MTKDRAMPRPALAGQAWRGNDGLIILDIGSQFRMRRAQKSGRGDPAAVWLTRVRTYQRKVAVPE